MREADKNVTRRSFLRTVAIGAIAGTATSMFIDTYHNTEDCIGDGKCKKCLALEGCGLPLAADYRKTHNHSTHTSKKGVKHG